MKGISGLAFPRAAWWIVLLALAVRVAFAVVSGLDAPPRSDEIEYDRYAWNLAQGRGYRGPSPDVADQDHLTAYRPPGPSLLWAGVYLVFGHNTAAARLTNCLIGALTCLVIFALGRRTFGEKTGLGAAAVFAVWPSTVYLTPLLLSEPLGTLTFLLLLLALLQYAEKPGRQSRLLAGALLGASLYVHATRLFLVPLLVIWALWQFRGNRRAMLGALTVPVLGLTLMIPWTIRNYVVFGRFIPFSTMGGSVLLQGNNRIVATVPQFYGYNIWDTRIPEYRDALRAPNDEVERDATARRLATAWIRDNAAKMPALVAAKIVRGWTPFLRPPTPLPQRLMMLASWGPVLVLFLLVFFPTLRKWLREGHPGWLLHLAVLHVVLVNAVFFGYARYRQPVEPLCILIAWGGVAAYLAARRLRAAGGVQSASGGGAIGS